MIKRIERGGWSGLLGVLCLGIVSCSQPADDKIPITTSSEEARALYLQGREFTEQLRATDARQFFIDAIAKDEEFALAHYALATSATSINEFFEEMRKAVSLAYKVSDGERWMILGLEAGARTQLATQREYFSKVVEAYPRDERAQVLLGDYHFGQQEFSTAIEYYQNAIDLNPDYARIYNTLGYSYRFIDDHPRAEAAFQKYIALLPKEPNPYDSYAEFLMEVGRFQESIANYQRALSISPQFAASYVGIGHNQIFMGNPVAARQTYEELRAIARNNAERRAANLWTAASYLYEGDYDAALGEIDKNYALAEEAGDLATMANDEGIKFQLFLESGRPAEGLVRARAGLEMLERADVPIEVKEAGRRALVVVEARAALGQGDLVTAHDKAAEYRQRIAAQHLPGEVRQYHLLAGEIALAEDDLATALKALSVSNQRNVRVLYLSSLAHKGLGNLAEGRSFCERAANANEITLGYALIRRAALAELATYQQ